MPRKFRSVAFLVWPRDPDGHRKNDQKRAVALTVGGAGTKHDFGADPIRNPTISLWRVEIRSTNLHIVDELNYHLL